MKKLLLFVLLFSQNIFCQFLEKKGDLKKYEGYYDFYYNPKTDEIYLEVDKLDSLFLYNHALRSGVGSNDIGLDRGQLGGASVVKFQRAGDKLLLVEPNQRYRAVTDNELEKQSIEEAFAKSVIYGFDIKEEKDDTFIIDLTPFVMEDAHGVAERLKRGNYGSYKVSKNKSALQLDRTKAFPKNVEFESLLTFEGSPQSGTVRSVVPDAANISVIQHYSFVELPDDKYEKRLFDPRSGVNSISYYDYASPVYEPILKRYAVRQRLEKKNPEAEVSEAVEPIIYYLDPGTPEPVRSALLEGASWWNQAYESIGYKDAFQVKMLPADADPLDVRYNVIQWVHRSTRGWSYGASVVDPRTGEIIKGHVSLGSLRIRQDFMIAQALLNKPFAESDENHEKMMEMAIARIRQLSAHEVGHTLGFAHNFAASVSDRASVMDYPHPQFSIENGEITAANAYDTNIGEWDKLIVKYAYSDLPDETSERAYLNSVIQEAYDQGIQFISDRDARPQNGAHVNAHLWDNGKDATAELNDVLEIREKAIANFSKDNFRTNEPYSVLEDVFVPLYFFHRYQTEAVSKLVGGLDYNFAVKGGAEKVVETLSPKRQKSALDALIKTLKAETLAIPQEKLALFPPRAFGYGRSRESFKSNTGVAFDALGAPATASDMTLGLLLNPERMARLIQQKSLDKKQLGLEDLLEKLIAETIQYQPKDSYLLAAQYTINYNVLQHLFNLAASKKSTPLVKAEVNYQLAELEDWLDEQDDAIYEQMLEEIELFFDKPGEFEPMPDAPKIPDGSPIGSFMCTGL
ncbi:zinc-dependent metalloprotease [Zunongwangia sp. SCSIO 43204]|uniref:zinc-dependent metalloprotease n=1 Tax=Zunongwangia sp. SCSIO 43204 TaxID=2779359 RepID=UPI001CA9ACBF|nr:zinc-dependent metalloprotease [Zunongwangia sp. SCSIO 43204]UAB82984.1 zinc-dependent metalloprotease [Zunongwangia sp. SCSIO 43204]